MNQTIQEDATRRPQYFCWNGPVSETRVRDWTEARRLSLPADLVELWVTTGGGDLFETETILGPFGSIATADDVDSVNLLERARGLAPGYLIFHVGLGGFTAVRLNDLQYVTLDTEHREGALYTSLDSWYRGVLRAEYGERYGLSALLSDTNDRRV
jgi:hypothetical protein